jgi:hypothetical protein
VLCVFHYRGAEREKGEEGKEGDELRKRLLVNSARLQGQDFVEALDGLGPCEMFVFCFWDWTGTKVGHNWDVTAFTFGADNDKGHCISKTFDK